MSLKISIWHNASCSTSRKSLDFIESNFEEIAVREYLNNPPSVAEIKEILKKMKQPATYILRKKDPVFLELFGDKEMSNAAWIKAMSKYPSIIERPIILVGEKAFLARPFDEVVEKIKSEFLD